LDNNCHYVNVVNYAYEDRDGFKGRANIFKSLLYQVKLHLQEVEQ